jgi:PST family polysaccharide transporter
MTAEQFLSLCLNFYVGITVVRYLGPEATGAISYAGAIAGLLGPLATLGLESIIIRELARGGNDRSEIWQTARKLLWGVTALNTLILGWIALTQPSGSMQQVAVWATTASSFANLSTLHLWTFRAESRYREIAKLRLLQMILLQSLRFAMVICNAPFIAFAAMMALDPLFTAITTSLLSRKRLGEVIGSSAANLEIAKKLLAESWPLILTGFGIMIYMRIDLIMLERFSSVRAVGVFSAATRISELFYMAPMILGRAIYPKMARLRTQSPQQFISFYYIFISVLISISAITIITMQFIGPWLISTIYGNKFNDSVNPFMIHIWTTLPAYIGVAVTSMYQFEGESKPQMFACFAGAIANAALNYYFIPIYGASGAAYATVIAQTIAVFLPIVVYPNCRKIALGRHLSI